MWILHRFRITRQSKKKQNKQKNPTIFFLFLFLYIENACNLGAVGMEDWSWCILPRLDNRRSLGRKVGGGRRESVTRMRR